MDKYCKWGLWVRIALPFLLFVVAGSIILCAWLYMSARKESHDLFITLARTNADFIQSSRLPTSERMAVELGRILDMQVCFRDAQGRLISTLGGEFMPLAQSLSKLDVASGVVKLNGDYEAIATPIDEAHTLLLIRPAHDAGLLWRPSVLVVLVSFWALSLVLAWTLARGVVRPLRTLAMRLPHIENDDVSQLPGLQRNDEIGMLARTYRDTHLQLVAERERREKAERLALLGKMATGLAHEINNPLSSIRMHAQLLESASTGNSEFMNGAIPVILGETSKIEGLVNQWMFLARPAPPQVSSVELGELVAGVLLSLQPQATHARVVIQNEFPVNLRANADARRIRQAVGNIVLNAMQAMPGGGTLRITGECAPQTKLIFKDTGGGFSANALLHHADLFYSEKEGGMGIGLSVTSEIIKAHDGSIEVENLPGGGASVTLILPAISESL